MRDELRQEQHTYQALSRGREEDRVKLQTKEEALRLKKVLQKEQGVTD